MEIGEKTLKQIKKLSDFVNKSDAFRSYNQTKEDERFALQWINLIMNMNH